MALERERPPRGPVAVKVRQPRMANGPSMVRSGRVPWFRDGRLSLIEPQQAVEVTEAPGTPRFRAIVLGLFFIIIMAYVVPYISFLVKTGAVSMSGSFAWAQIPTGPFAVLVLLARFVVPLLGRLRLRKALTGKDALLVYAVVLPTLAIAGGGMLWYVPSLIAYPYYADSGHPIWFKQIMPHLPSWIMAGGQPGTEAFVRHLYEGNPDGSARVPWGFWAGPLGAWMGMLAMMFFTSLCLTGMFRRRWFRQEHITFPFAELALAVSGAPSSWDTQRGIFREKLMWLGFAVPFLHAGLVAMAFFIKGFPDLGFKDKDLTTAFKAAPWSILSGNLPFRFQWMVLGIAYLIPSQVSIGTVAFYFISLLQALMMASFGAVGGDWYPYSIIQNQTTGGILVFSFFLFYAARHDIRRMWQDLAANIRGQTVTDPHPDRWLLLGAIVGAVGVTAWSHYAGLAVWVAATFVIVVLVFQLAVARMVAVLGMQHATMWISPSNLMYTAFGTRLIGADNIPSLKVQELVVWYAEQSSFWPMVLQAHKLGDTEGWRSSRYVPTMILAGIVGLIAYGFFYVRMAYQHSGIMMSPTWYFSMVPQGWFAGIAGTLGNLGDPSWVARGAALLGAVVMWGLMSAHRAFPWWPFHPLGYLLASGYTSRVTWPGLLLGWAIKTSVSKYGGEGLYFTARPLFLGFLVGDVAGQAFWAVVCAIAVAAGWVGT
jgi:hypothetical protein